MRHTTNIVLALSALVALQFAVGLGQPSIGATNVCNKTVAIKSIEIVDEPVVYKTNYEGRCGFFPCTKTREEVRLDSRPKIVYKDTVVTECCAGYLEDQNGACQPICLKGCGNGRCIEPEKCECQSEPTELKPGYSGASCNIYTCLDPNKWGAKCDKQCLNDCPKHAYCNALAGSCVCRPGWRGDDCTQSCNDTSCGVFELPTIMETELNVIRDIESAPLKLEPDGPEKLEPPTSGWSFVPQLELNIFLLAVIVCLVICYRKQIHALKNSLYYAPSTDRSNSSGGSVYSAYSSSSTNTSGKPMSNIANRPLVPIPNDKNAHYLDTNLSFASATRSIVNGPVKSSPERSSVSSKPTTGTKHENHLQASHENSQQNIYLDVDPNQNENFYSVPKSSPASTQTKLSSTQKEEADEDHSYQVPNSRSVFIKLPQEEVVHSNESQNEVIYEEIPFERNQMNK